MPKHHVGHLDEASKLLLEGEFHDQQSESTRPTFPPTRSWTKATLSSKKTVSWDSRIFTFKLEQGDQTLGIPTGYHLMIRLSKPATKKMIVRPYTPISEPRKRGYVEILVKIYFASEKTTGGPMSQALDALPLGSALDFKGPIGTFQ